MRGLLDEGHGELVRGPSRQSVISPSGAAMTASMMRSTPWTLQRRRRGRAARPSLRGRCRRGHIPPCCSGLTIGRAQPGATRMSGRPASSRIWRAFRSVLPSGTLPATAVTATTSSSGEPSASRMAKASSWPGSVSMMILRALMIPRRLCWSARYGALLARRARIEPICRRVRPTSARPNKIASAEVGANDILSAASPKFSCLGLSLGLGFAWMRCPARTFAPPAGTHYEASGKPEGTP